MTTTKTSVGNVEILALKKAQKEKTLKQMLTAGISIYGLFIGSIFFTKSLTMYMHHDTKSIISPVVAEEERVKIIVVTPEPTPTKTPVNSKKEYIQSKSHGDILLRIWTNESSRGTSNGLAESCKIKGLTNEFGYYPQAKYCFSDFKYSVDQINTWFDDCLAIRSLKACLLRYSGNSKEYVDNFLSQSNN